MSSTNPECASRPGLRTGVRNDTDGSFDFCGMFEPRYLAFAAVECVGTTATFESAAANMSTTIHEVQDSVFSFPGRDTLCASVANITRASVNIAANCNSTQSCAWNVDDGACEVSDAYPAPTPAEPDVVCVTLNETWCESAESCTMERFFVRAFRRREDHLFFDDSRIHRRGTSTSRSTFTRRRASRGPRHRRARRTTKSARGERRISAASLRRAPPSGAWPERGAARRHRDVQARTPPTKGVRCPA